MPEPWEKIAWSEEHEQIIYREWGVFYTGKQQLDIAAHYYNKSLDIKNDDVKALLYRSGCKRFIAMTEGALMDGSNALAIDDLSQPVNLAVCDALYDLNQFEKCNIELHNDMRKFSGKKTEAFQNRIDVVEGNFNDTIGDTLGPFILENSKHFEDVLEDLRRRQHIDTRPLWKILKELEKCDVVSILEKEEELLHPREIARRERTFKVFNQIYYNNSWIDVLFLKALRTNPNLLLRQAKSTPFLEKQVRSKYAIVLRFLKMLQARNPLYTENFKRCPNKKLAKKEREDHLYRVQYQTRRSMFIILKRIKMLRKKGKVQELSKYIEEVMGDYIVLKTRRVMPWKFEFINEVYNVLGLAYADRLTIPANLSSIPQKDRLLTVMRLPRNRDKDKIVEFIFGDRSTYEEPDAPDYGYIKYKKLISRLEKRLYFADYSIEKCYILHAIGKNHLQQSKFDECCSVARKVSEEANNCQNSLWKFLGEFLICKSNVAQNKIERVKESFERAQAIAQSMKNERIIHFMDICIGINEEEIDAKKKRQSYESMTARRRRKSSMSVGAMSNMTSASMRSERSERSDEDV